MGEELKPCPFCGGEGRVHNYERDVEVGCFADDCAANPTVMTTHERGGLRVAVAAWNTRALADGRGAGDVLEDAAVMYDRAAARGDAPIAPHLIAYELRGIAAKLDAPPRDGAGVKACRACGATGVPLHLRWGDFLCCVNFEACSDRVRSARSGGGGGAE